jgi:hypothetical protein
VGAQRFRISADKVRSFASRLARRSTSWTLAGAHTAYGAASLGPDVPPERPGLRFSADRSLS